MVAQFIAKTVNLERPIYFLSLKFHMLFTCKNFKFSDLTWKKKFLLQKMVGDWRPSCSPPPFLYGPVLDPLLQPEDFLPEVFLDFQVS